jgi:hypothetical protein
MAPTREENLQNERFDEVIIRAQSERLQNLRNRIDCC